MKDNNTAQAKPPVTAYPKQAKSVIARIPFLNLPDLPLVSTTQAEIPIADITNDMVLFKDGGAAIVMETTSLNFGLLSEKEQEAVVYSYAALLNSLSFSIQILVRSQRKDISNYLTYLADAANKIQNPKLTIVMNSYRAFISEIVKKKNVLGKRFFIVLPFSPLELGAKQSFSTITKSGPLPFPKSYIIKKAQVGLNPKKDHMIRQAGRLSLKLSQLTTSQLIELFYDFYNPKAPAISKPA
jgi:hypothetical protein